MRNRIWCLLVALICMGMANDAFAQFSCDRVMVYVKAGQTPSQARSVVVIGYFAEMDEIRNFSSDAERIRKTIVSHPDYFESPYNIPDRCSDISVSHIAPKWCRYNPSASTSKFRVYSGHEKSGYNAWGQYTEGSTKNWAFSKDCKQMIFWVSGKEEQRTVYLLTELSEFDPLTSSSSDYEFLE